MGSYGNTRTPSRSPAKVSQVIPDLHETWSKSWFLTFDVDWAPEPIVNDTLEILNEFRVPSTWMITHESTSIGDLRAIPGIELGIHPNFNDLLSGRVSDQFSSARSVVDRLMGLVPEAKSVRAHSMAQSSRILDLFAEFGLSHDLNAFVPSGSGNVCSPWKLWNGVVRVPCMWEDDIWCLYESTDQPELTPSQLVSDGNGIVVINFHPIHVYLNTENLERYESLRHLHHDAKALLEYRFEGYGTRNRLIDLLSIASAS